MLVFFVQRGCCVVSSEGAAFRCGEDEWLACDGAPSRQETVEDVGLFSEMLWVPTSGNTMGVSLGYTSQPGSCVE